MDPFAALQVSGHPQAWSLANLDPMPEEEWRRMRDFLHLSQAEIDAMLTTVEALFKRGHELVVGTYDYLLANPETAAILGWEGGADPRHLSERRRFFTVWLARLLGMDFSADMAYYLFRAGKFHAAHGPRRTHVPPVYVTGSMSLVNATFAHFLMEEMPGERALPLALAGWNKLLTLHLHMMQMGYQAALAVDSGDFAIELVMFGRMRNVAGLHHLTMRLPDGADAQEALRKFFNYVPQARNEVFLVEWKGGERDDARGTPWFTVAREYTVRPNWRVLLNGKDLAYVGGVAARVHPGDEIHFFPPGR